MTTFFDPPHLQAICLKVSINRGILSGLLLGRADWTLEQFKARPPAQGLSDKQIDTQRREDVAFLNDKKFSIEVTGEDATITFPPFAFYPYLEPMPPALVPRMDGRTIIYGYTWLYQGIVPITKCLVWDDRKGRQRFVTGFTVGERGFVKMPESWMLDRGTERVCNEALAGERWYMDARKAVEYAETLVYSFQVRDMALNGELPECLIDLERPRADVDVVGLPPEEDNEEQVLSFAA
ncbi:MAG: hypothetical protein ACRYGP_01230 [Janthinobacterium lividum]